MKTVGKIFLWGFGTLCVLAIVGKVAEVLEQNNDVCVKPDGENQNNV